MTTTSAPSATMLAATITGATFTSSAATPTQADLREVVGSVTSIPFVDCRSKVDWLLQLPMSEALQDFFVDSLTTTVASAKGLCIADSVELTSHVRHMFGIVMSTDAGLFQVADLLVATTYLRRIQRDENALRAIGADAGPLLCERLATASIILANMIRLDAPFSLRHICLTMPMGFRTVKELNPMINSLCKLLQYSVITSNEDLSALEPSVRSFVGSGLVALPYSQGLLMVEGEDDAERIALESMQLLYPDEEEAVDGCEDENGEMDMDLSDDDYSDASSPGVPTPPTCDASALPQDAPKSLWPAYSLSLAAPVQLPTTYFDYGSSTAYSHGYPVPQLQTQPRAHEDPMRARFYAADPRAGGLQYASPYAWKETMPAPWGTSTWGSMGLFNYPAPAA